MSQKSLLGHLAFEMGSQPEVVATGSLAYILQTSSNARHGFGSLMTAAFESSKTTLSYQHQAGAADSGRPDIVGVNHSGDIEIVVEAKFWAGLTENQPVGYLNIIESADGMLIFVCPDVRIDSLFSVVCERIEAAGLTVDSLETRWSSLRRCHLSDGKNLLVVGWTAVLSRIEGALSPSDERPLIEDVRQLSGLCERISRDEYQPLASTDLGPEVPRRLMAFNNILDSVLDRAKSNRIATTDGMRRTPTANGYVRYCKWRNLYVALGVDYFYWSEYEASPFWLWSQDLSKTTFTEKSSVLAEMELATPAKVVFEQQEPLFPLRVNRVLDRHGLVADLYDQIDHICQRFSSEIEDE